MKKKVLFLLFISFFSLFIYSCEWFKTTTEQKTTENKVDYISINEIKEGIIGNTYITKANVIATGKQGILIYDETDFIYVYLGYEPTVMINEEVVVYGTTEVVKDEIQINATKLTPTTNAYAYNFDVIKLDNENLVEFSENFNVGDYVRLSGTLSVKNNGNNLEIPDSEYSMIIDTNQFLNEYDGNKVIIEGYVKNLKEKTFEIILAKINLDNEIKYLPLTILSVNDLHGAVEQNGNGEKGLANMSYLINEIRNENFLDDVILIGNGDMFQGTYISNITYGRVVIECMNQMGFDALGIGNHEFDWGIEKILQYFDGDVENGEASFPLLNANIYNENDNSLLTIEDGNVLESYVVEREGIEVGIISYIGDVYRSISYDKVYEYYFDLNIKNSVKRIAQDLKQNGVDIIVVNIHGGNYNIHEYEYNNELAHLTDDYGNYLVDAVINGHTHSRTSGEITRSGTSMPVIQARANGEYFGRITLNIDLDTKEVIDTDIEIINVASASTYYDANVEKIINDYQENYADKVLVKAGETVDYRSDYYNWIGNVMLAATGADIAIHNTGGVRSTGNVVANQNLMLSQLYEISPFDNNLYILEVRYIDIKHILDNTALFIVKKEGISFQNYNTYKVVVISYVYFWDQFNHLRSDSDVKTSLYIRDILIEDLLAKNAKGEVFRPKSNPKATIGNLLDK